MFFVSVFCLIFGFILLFIGGLYIEKENPVSVISAISNNMDVDNTSECLYVTATALNVREKPDLESRIKYRLVKNEKICNYKHDGEFIKMDDGYVFSKYLDKYQVQEDNNPIKQTNKPFLLTSVNGFRDIANGYLASGDYKGAMMLAIEENSKNPTNIDTWEIFARSMYLDGNKEEAINVLRIFLLDNDNEHIRNLLHKMEKNLDI